MKFVAAIAVLVAAAGVSAQDGNCEAEYIVSRCLKTETDKVTACVQTDFECLCAAYQAVATCYNNCPNDARAPSAQVQVSAYCRYVNTTTSSAAVSAATSAAAAASSSSAGIATKLNAPAPSTTTGFVSGSATPSAGGVAPRAGWWLASPAPWPCCEI
ncbi:hypothetical protein ISF_07930 [Cordyceps fumosorosea ARSEF 2679]|uniref:GPI anchored serine-threonine rich protein n=1 Tax=Cordyceps fumosorosea (strain ARSEF 2679) TaxID=1081104 RepID=A0A167ND73_CORFA|nr:hypothetical protein ISF_07930 [Cordyceps fumosorosea ARSEF 2679]OAA55419.1 hypothetical protein ISF_07930 [Cordyceps fumosorosea ARSEF 2679]